ncbi:MAG: Gfo/Idh/MocA family oxidoreductase [Lentisphaeraceae bacterium]|nr:Gfo/Idh/MocA family oxidoreductase [Lentisphaeraceae bacterium]
MSKNLKTNRRDFVKISSALASISILPSHMLFGKNTPSEQFRFAQIGCGGKGSVDMRSTIAVGGKLVAMCDVDKKRSASSIKQHKDIPLYNDYRVLLDKHDKEIDGVVVSTPDHTHGCIALEAIKRGKHVYVQKPLTRTFEECKVLHEAAKKYNVVTQMGNQGHAGSGLKLWQQMQDENAFGDIKHIHTWSDRPIWPQGMKNLPTPEPTPENLDWDLWLGPVANRPYSSKYLPFNWRGWWDFGCGAMGDMACHNMDPAFWILKLGIPDKVKATVSAPVKLAYPDWSTVEYTFNKSPVTGKPVKLTWYDGKKLPVLPEGSHPDLEAGTNGCIIEGSKMSALGGMCAGRPRPVAIGGKEYGSHVKELERHWRGEAKKHKDDDNYGLWVEAAKAGDPDGPGSRFDYSAPFTQAILIGCIAQRFPGQELHWDHAKAKFSNSDEANQWLGFTPRKGYSLSL